MAAVGTHSSVVWVTGAPGCGKTTTGDYLAMHCGFTHIDVDGLMYSPPSPRFADAKGAFQASLGKFWRGQPVSEDQFGPFLHEVCRLVLETRAAAPERRVVLTFALHRAGRDLVRSVLGEDLCFISLVGSPEKQAARWRSKQERMHALQGLALDSSPQEFIAEMLVDGGKFNRLIKFAGDCAVGGEEEDTGGGRDFQVFIAEDRDVMPTVIRLLSVSEPERQDDGDDETARITSAIEENWIKMAKWRPWEPT